VPLASATSVVEAWLPPITAAVGALGVLIGIFKTRGDYHLKAAAQASEANARAAESDVRLADAFARLAETANGRRPSADDVGLSTQVAAIAALAELTKRHEALGVPGRAALAQLLADFEEKQPALRAAIETALNRLEKRSDWAA
jgi:hypothetical protein